MATVTWDGGQSISASVSGQSVTITLSGRATLNLGAGITVEAGYRLYEGNTDLGALSNKTITVSNQSVGSHTYTVKGYYYNSGSPITTSSGNPSRTVTVADPTPRVVWNGTPTFTATYAGNGNVTFTLNGSATAYWSGVSSEAGYEIFIGDSHVVYLTNKTATVEYSPGARTFTCKAYLYSSQLSPSTYYSSNNPSANVNIPAPTLTWSSGANLSYEASGQNLIMHINGSVTEGNGYSGHTVYYVLYYGNTQEAGEVTSKNITVTNGVPLTENQWSLYAYVYTGGKPTYSSPLTVMVSWSDYVAYYNGSRWIQCIPYYYNGSSWVECKPYYYNGTSWVETSYKP